MTAITVKYTRSRALRDRLFAETGEFYPAEVERKLGAIVLSPEERLEIARLIDDNGVLTVQGFAPAANPPYHCRRYPYTLDTDIEHEGHLLAECRRVAEQKSAAILAGREQRKAAILRDVANRERELEAAIRDHIVIRSLPGIPRSDREFLAEEGVRLEAFESLLARYESLDAEFRRETEEREAATDRDRISQQEQADRERADRHARRLAWAEQFGSDHLRRALRAGHDAARLFWDERTEHDYPGYLYDHGDVAEWKSRSLPSIEALDELDRVRADHPAAEAYVVWLTVPPKGVDDEAFDECEAVAVDDPEFDRHVIKIVA